MERLNAWNKYDEDMKKKVFDFADEYRRFISLCKTERECVEESVRILKASGYKDLKDVIAADEKLKAGDKVYAVNMNKAIVAFNIGEDSIESGMNILGAHIDSPRLDIKQNPLYEETGPAGTASNSADMKSSSSIPYFSFNIASIFFFTASLQSSLSLFVSSFFSGILPTRISSASPSTTLAAFLSICSDAR